MHLVAMAAVIIGFLHYGKSDTWAFIILVGLFILETIIYSGDNALRDRLNRDNKGGG